MDTGIMTVEKAEAAVSVRGYYRKNGTYVAPHYRSNPDSNPYNNWSFPGNKNPYTGKKANGNPDTYLKKYYKPKVSSFTNLPSIQQTSSSSERDLFLRLLGDKEEENRLLFEKWQKRDEENNDAFRHILEETQKKQNEFITNEKTKTINTLSNDRDRIIDRLESAKSKACKRIQSASAIAGLWYGDCGDIGKSYEENIRDINTEFDLKRRETELQFEKMR